MIFCLFFQNILLFFKMSIFLMIYRPYTYVFCFLYNYTAPLCVIKLLRSKCFVASQRPPWEISTPFLPENNTGLPKNIFLCFLKLKLARSQSYIVFWLLQITDNVTDFLFCTNCTFPYQITDNTAATDHRLIFCFCTNQSFFVFFFC